MMAMITENSPEGEDKLRIECEVWVETDTGEKVMVGQCSGLVARTI